MATSIVAFASPKGGSGKTITALSIAEALAALDFSVLLVDLDHETTGLTLFFLDEVLAAKTGATEGAFETQSSEYSAIILRENLSLLPAQYHLRPIDEAHSVVPKAILDRAVLARAGYDYVLLDLQAGADPVALDAAVAADQVVVVAEYDPVSAQGVKRLERLYPPSFSVEKTWVLYNKVLPDVAKSIGELLQVERRLPPIAWTADVVRHYLRGESPLNMADPDAYTTSILETVSFLFRGEVRLALEEWRAEARASLRAPLKEKLSELNEQLADLGARRIQLEHELGRLQESRSSRLISVFGSDLPIRAAPALAIAGMGTFLIPGDGPVWLRGVLVALLVCLFLVLTVTASLVGTRSHERSDLRDRLHDLEAREMRLDVLRSELEVSVVDVEDRLPRV